MYEGQALRRRLQAGTVCLGTWVDTTDPCIVELVCGSGYDFIIIDSEHGALTIETIQQDLMATKGSGVTAVVRVAWNDQVLIKQVLDAGAGGILVPLVRTAAEAERAVAACLYPPQGVRGFGPRRPSNYERNADEYIATANDSIVVWVQIEHVDAVDNIDAIVRTPRLDSVIIGSNDLSGSMGLLGQPRHPRVLAAIERVMAAARVAGLPVGIAGPSEPEAALRWLRAGMQFITLGSAAGLLSEASDAAVRAVRGLASTPAESRPCTETPGTPRSSG
ncbi:MAG: HpcH/HpaI aldolase family protein [Anaerolineae bacterium]